MRFNLLLSTAGVDPAKVKLVRHQDSRGGKVTPYALWMANDGRLERYQSLQSRPVFAGAELLAAFIATPLNETLFVGAYSVGDVSPAPPGSVCPITGPCDVGDNHYDLGPLDVLSEYRGRLVVDWGTGFRSWVQSAAIQDKRILEIRKSAREAPFPGFMEFREQLSRLAGVPASWREVLSSVSGIYLLTCPRTGKQYVGSATGNGGFWGRWESYVASGHGGNKRLIDIPAADYQVTILEVVSSAADERQVIETESRWKMKLMSRTFGLNAN